MVQSFNAAGILGIGRVLLRPSLLLPHVAVPHIGHLDFQELKNIGVSGVIFDKDNTLTAPYLDEPHELVANALENARRVYGENRLLIISNSAGTLDDAGE